MACSFDHSISASGAESDGAIEAIDSSTLDASKTDGEVIGSDRDGDGILDEVDNCPDIPNTDQRNEDEDRFGNLCDNCPAENNQDQSNHDLDGLGDMCDPQPGLVNEILYFEGFDESPSVQGWVGLEAWQVDSGSLVQNDNGQRYYLHYNGINRPDNVQVVAKIQFSNPAPFNDIFFRYGGIFAEANTDPDGNGCWLLRNLRQPASEGYSVVSMDDGDLFSTNPAGPALADNTDYVIKGSVNGTIRSCSFEQGGAPITIPYTSTDFEGQGVGIVSSYTRARVAYFYVVGLQ